MPLYRITAPNGQTYQIEGPPGASDADVASAVMAQYPDAGSPAPKQSTIGSELKRGARQVASSMQTAYGALAGSPEEAAKAGVERGQAISQAAGEGVGFEPVKKAYQEKGLMSAAGEALGQIPRALAGQGANLAAMAGGARLGAMAGSAIAPGVGTVVGGALGAGAAMLPQFFGSNVERQASEQMEKGEPVKIDRTKAGVAAAGQAALEGAGTAFTLGKGVVKGILGVADDAALTSAKAAQQLEATARRSLTGTVARGAGRGAVSEIPTEVAQQIIERAQAGLDLTSPDALKEYGEAAYQAGLVGGPLGGAGNVVTRGQARTSIAERDARAAAKAQAERAAAEQAAEEAKANAEPKLPLVTAPGAQGEMFAPAEMGTPPAAPQLKQVTPAELKPIEEAQPAQLDLGLDYQRAPADLVLEAERLKRQPGTPEAEQRLMELQAQTREYNQNDIESIRAEKERKAQEAKQDAEARKRFPALAGDIAPAPAQVAPRPGALTVENLQDTGVSMGPGVKAWAAENVVGKTKDEVRAMADKDPSLTQGKSQRAKLLREVLAPEAAPFKEAPSVEPTPAPTPAVEQPAQPGPSEPSVGVPSEPAVAKRPTLRLKPASAAPAPVAPDGRGLVPAGQPAVQGTEAQGAKPAAVAPAKVKAEKPAKVSKEDMEVPEVPHPPSVQRLENAKTRAEFESALDDLVRIQRSEDHPDKDAVGEFLGSNLRFGQFEKALRAAENRMREKPKAPAPLPATEPVTPKAKKPLAPRKNDAFYEPVGISRKTGKVLRGPQMMTQPMDDKRARKYLEDTALADEGEGSDISDFFAELDAEIEAEETNAGGKQMELDFAPSKERSSVKTKAAKGQSLGSLQQEVASAKGPMAEALRRMVRSGKVKLEEAHPEGNKGGLFDGKTVTLYAQGIPEGQALGVALHEVGAHMGLVKLLGQNQYDALVNTLLDWIELNDNSPQAKLAQAAYRRIPIKDIKNPDPTVARDEMVAYFVEELANAEAIGKLPKQGPLRVVWNKIKTAILTSLNKALGRSFGISGLTPQQIGMLAEAAMVRESKAGIDESGEAKQQFSVAPGTEALIDSMGPLDAEQKSGLQRLITGFKTQDEVNYATKFRTQTADAAATIEHRLREQFDGAVRDSLGKFNPMGLYRQAQDHAKLLLEYFQQGSLVKDTATGLWRVDTTKGVRPPAEVYALIDKWADKNGYTRERATQLASRILEGVRLDAMRTSNQNDGTNFLLHLKDAEIDQLLREYNADPDLKAMSKLMDEARLAMVDNMVAVGRLSPEQGQAWKDAAGYVPFDRLEDFAERFSKIKKISNKGLAQVGKLPELVGSLERPVGNVFDNYLNTLGWMVGQTMKTDATVQTLRALEDLGQAKFLGRSNLSKANAVGMYVGGEMMYWDLPSKYDVLAFKDLNPPKAHWLRALGEFSNVLRKSVTVLPPFALKQVTDDVQRAILTSGVKSPSALLRMSLTNFPKLALAELRGIQHPMVREFGALGLTGEYDFQAGKPATSLLKDLGYKPRGKFETILHRLDGITRASDLSVRKAIYDQTMNETNDQLLAQTRAREFINFRRRGASDFVGAMVTVIPFFNAYIQGMDVLYRAASGKDSSSSVDRAQARRLFWSRAGTVMMLASLYAVGKDEDDEDYKEMDLRTRDGNWILPGGYKIPVPGELGALFKVVPERVVEYMKRQGTPEEQDAWEATRTALTYIYEQYVGRATPVPQAVKPLLEAWANKSFLTGRPLEGFHHQQMEPNMRRTEQTSELAVAISDFSKDTIGVQVSPIMVDNALRGYFGSTAALLTATTDSLLNPTRVDRPLHKWALVSNYLYDPVGTRRMTEFYEEREKVGKAGATLRELMNTDIDRATTYAEEHADELMLEKSINATLQYLEETRAYRKYLNSAEGAKELSADDREAQLKEVKQMEVQYTGWLREAKAAMRQ